MEKAYIILQEYRKRKAICCYLGEDSINYFAWAIYLDTAERMEEAIFHKLNDLYRCKYKILFYNRLPEREVE